MAENLTEITCIHRHTREEHPSCFATGNVIDRRPDPKTPWWQLPGLAIGYLDIESDGLEADRGTMLTWCIKPMGSAEIVSDRIVREELFSGRYDERLVKSIIEELRKYSIIVTYYGTNFDLPFIRAKALHYGYDFPGYGEIYHFDLYYTVRNKLALTRNSLAVATAYLNIPGKTPLDMDIWRRAKYGDTLALNEVLTHNMQDVIITEKLHNKLMPFRKWIKSSV